MRGMKYAMKSGIGTASIDINRVVIGALVAVNAVGDVWIPKPESDRGFTFRFWHG
jgi:L-aminopeptidase/D-esterase-like protein